MRSSKIAFVLIALLVLFIAACAPVAPGGAAGDGGGAPVSCSEAEITEADGAYDLGGCVLRIAVENAYQPFNFIDTDSGEAVGYDYDIFAEICDRANCSPEFVETSWDAMVAVMGGRGRVRHL